MKMLYSMQDITGIVVSSNTISLLTNAYESIRNFHPDMQIIIIDGSSENDPCYDYVSRLKSNPRNTIVLCKYNIGHGRGMDYAIGLCKTKVAMIFDSDIRMLKSPVEKMLAMMESDTYGVGYLEKTGLDGYEYGAHANHKTEPFMWMLHPYFQLLQISEYHKFHPYVHHGAPCYLAALDIYRKGLTSKIIKEFPGLGHSSGKGWNWVGEPREYIQHDTAGTRKARKLKGKSEIDGGWVYEKNSSFGNRFLDQRIQRKRF